MEWFLFSPFFKISFCFQNSGFGLEKSRAWGWTPFSPRWSISSSVLLQVSPPLSARRSILKKGFLLKEKQFLNVVFAVEKCLPIKYVYVKSTTVFVLSSELGVSQPLSRQRVCPSPQNRGGSTLAGEGLGESQFRRLEKSLALCLLCGLPTLEHSRVKSWRMCCLQQ